MSNQILCNDRHTMNPTFFCLLNDADHNNRSAAQNYISSLTNRLKSTLHKYGIKGRVTAIKKGPVITTFEYSTAWFTNARSISGLQDDLSIALGVGPVRVITASSFHKVKIEVPNLPRNTICLKEVIADQNYLKSTDHIPVALGKDTLGNVVVADLTEMRHLLITGSAGSGKTTFINSTVISLLYRFTPEQLRVVLIDSQKRDLSGYMGIPHLYSPVITGSAETEAMLSWVMDQIELRQRLLSNEGLKNIFEYNALLPIEDCTVSDVDGARNTEVGRSYLQHKHLPYIILVVDEFSTLNVSAINKIEELIFTLAQKGTAAGIHLILSTAFPNRIDIFGLTSKISATRVSFKLYSRAESFTMFKSVGAEALLCEGDMVAKLPGRRQLQRIHGACISPNEMLRAINYFKGGSL